MLFGAPGECVVEIVIWNVQQDAGMSSHSDDGHKVLSGLPLHRC